jgi:cytochrome c peroxidase
MHDGSLGTLEEVVEFYDRGGIDNPEKDSRLHPLGLTTAEKVALVAFLKTLTGDNIAALIRDARRVPPVDHLPERDPATVYSERH